MKLARLIVKKLNSTISEEEGKLLSEWLRKEDDNMALFARISKLKDNGVDISELTVLRPKLAWNKVLQKHKIEKTKKENNFTIKPFLRYIAVFIGVISLGGYAYFKYISLNNKVLELEPDQVTLKLDNGKIQLLSSDGIYAITDTQGNVLCKKEGNKLNYKNSEIAEKPVYNTLITPNGKRYEITLFDGTAIHLNSGSSIRYPVKFSNGNNRQLFLKGEAFFDVIKDDKHPFIVSTSGMNITVLGTKFNVSAYPEDNHINTVLVEGLINLSSDNTDTKQSNTTVQLEPGYKAEWNIYNKTTTIEPVDTDIYTSWISGVLVIKNTLFKNIIHKLERHYNIKIQNNYAEINDQAFTASFDVETIDEVLSSFAENRKFNFEIRNDTIIINKP